MNTPHNSTGSRSISTTLLQRAKTGDNQAWIRLFDVFSPNIYGWFRSRGISESEAPYLVNEVVSSAWIAIKTFHRDSDRSTFRGWLYRITRNKANDYYRAQNALQMTDSHLAAIPDPYEDDLKPNEKWASLLRVAESIRGDFQEQTYLIFCRIVIDGLDSKQVAIELGMKPSAVREAKRRFLQRLKEECLELLGEEYWLFDGSD